MDFLHIPDKGYGCCLIRQNRDEYASLFKFDEMNFKMYSTNVTTTYLENEGRLMKYRFENIYLLLSEQQIGIFKKPASKDLNLIPFVAEYFVGDKIVEFFPVSAFGLISITRNGYFNLYMNTNDVINLPQTSHTTLNIQKGMIVTSAGICSKCRYLTIGAKSFDKKSFLLFFKISIINEKSRKPKTTLLHYIDLGHSTPLHSLNLDILSGTHPMILGLQGQNKCGLLGMNFNPKSAKLEPIHKNNPVLMLSDSANMFKMSRFREAIMGINSNGILYLLEFFKLASELSKISPFLPKIESKNH